MNSQLTVAGGRCIALLAVSFLGLNVAHAGNDVKANGDFAGTVQNEVRIAHDFFHSTLIMAYNDKAGGAPPTPIGISYSSNGGLTWSDTQLSVPADPFSPPGSTLPVIFDPYISFGAPNNVYAGYIAAGLGASPSSAICIERSIDGGMTWTGPTYIDANPPAIGPVDPNYRFNDRPDMDDHPTGIVGVVWIKDVGVNLPTSDIYYAWSNPPPGPPPGPFPPTGLNFTAPVTVNDFPNGTDMANAPDIAIHPNGATYIAWIDVNVTVPNATTATIKLDKTFVPGPPVFGPDINVITIDPLPRNLSTSTGAADDVRAGSYPVIDLDDNDGAAQTIYMAYAATPQPAGPDEADIYFIKSTNGGATWSTPIRVNDDNTTTDQMHPAIASVHTFQFGTVITIAWYDKRNCNQDDRWDVYMTRSTDGGNTFAPNRLVTDQTYLTPLSAAAQPWMGEYLGVEMDGNGSGAAYIAFTSSVNDSRGDVYFDQVPITAVKAADIDNSGAVNVIDLLRVINAWGPCPPCQSCPADINRDGQVNVTDLLLAINTWG